MARKKRIERYHLGTSFRHLHEAFPDGDWVKYADHLDALGEVASTLATELASVRKHRDTLKGALARAPYPSDVGAAEAGREEETERAEAAEEALRAEEQHRLEVQRACIAANQTLAGLREAVANVKATEGAYEYEGVALDALYEAAGLDALQEDSKKPELSKCAGLGYKGGVWREGVANEPCPGCSDCQKPELSA